MWYIYSENNILKFMTIITQILNLLFAEYHASKRSSWWRRLLPSSSEDVLTKTNIFVFVIRLQDVQKTSLWPFTKRSLWRLSKTSSKTYSRHLQDIFKTSSGSLAKTSSRRFQNVFKTSSRHFTKMSSRRFKDVSSS